MRFIPTLTAVLALSGGADNRAAAADQLQAESLFEYKLELARHSYPYLHVTSDGVLVYLKNLLLKKLKVTRLNLNRKSPLQMSKVEAWWPVFEPPQWNGDSSTGAQGVPKARIVRVSEMPERYWIVLTNGTLFRISTGLQLESPLPPIPVELGPEVEKLGNPAANPVISIHLARTEAQELYWLIQRGTGVIY